MEQEPSAIEKYLVNLTMALFGRRLYRGFVSYLDLKGNEMVLDFGSGWGMNALLVAEKLDKGGRLTCLDVSRAWLDVARHRLRNVSNVDFVFGDISQAGLPGKSFDVIVVHLVLHHVEQSAREKTVKELARVLKDGGRLVIMDPLGSDHGTPVEEIRKLMIESGLKEGKNAVFRWHLFVDAYQATWSKPPCSPVACEMPAMT